MTGYTCITQLREPFSRAVSAWLYRGHHPGMDFLTPVGSRRCTEHAPCRSLMLSSDGWVWTWTRDGGPRADLIDASRGTTGARAAAAPRTESASFVQYVTQPGWANIATRMLGEGRHAYDPLAQVGRGSLQRAQKLLTIMPHVGLTEWPEALRCSLSSRVRDAASERDFLYFSSLPFWVPSSPGRE